MSLKKILNDIPRGKDFVFFQTSRFDEYNRYSYLFSYPLEIISCYNLSGVESSLNKIEKMLNKGFFAAGFISYESGFAFEPFFWQKKCYDFPLLWFGIFKKPAIFDHKYIRFEENTLFGDYGIGPIKADISEKEYIDSIEKIKKYIKEGHTYQVNMS
jgi:para-aminobenzoate synthetase / 4-amino-4-deoxychorismate lyase